MGNPSSEPSRRLSRPHRATRRPDLMSQGTTGSFVGSEPRKTETFEPGRTCAEPGCKTKLSIYNETGKCAAHPDNIVRGQTPGGSPF